MADDIEDALWDKVPRDDAGNSQRFNGKSERPPYHGPNGKSENPWISPDFWRSIGASGNRGAIFMGALVAILIVAGIVAQPQPSPVPNGDTTPTQEPQAVSETPLMNGADAPSPTATAEQLIGRWVQAERGGEDGKTKCAEAEVMTTLNGGSTNDTQFFRNGTVDHTLWYDPEFEHKGEPQVKAAYNNGTWSLSDNQFNISWKGGSTRLFGSDLGAGDDQVAISIVGNVLIETYESRSMRFVRCR